MSNRLNLPVVPTPPAAPAVRRRTRCLLFRRRAFIVKTDLPSPSQPIETPPNAGPSLQGPHPRTPGFNRWLVPPAALAIHLCIGQAYAFSVFKLPLNTLLGKAADILAPTGPSMELKGQDWTQPNWPGSSQSPSSFSAFPPPWPALGWKRPAPARAASWPPAVGALGSSCRLGATGRTNSGCSTSATASAVAAWIGDITPVSTLIKWFPDRRGMATGMAIMGFGGGAMIAAPLSKILMDQFPLYTPTTGPGVAEHSLSGRLSTSSP